MFNSIELAAMQASLRATQLQQQTAANNIANYETPGFKASNVTFNEVYANALNKGGNGKYKFTANVNTTTDTEVRPDGNNVDIERENMTLYQTYMQSTALYQKIGGHFSNYKYILANAPK